MSDWSERPFATLGSVFESEIGAFTSRTVSDIIPIIAPVVELGVTAYFMWYAWMILTGRSRRNLMDFIVEWLKVAVIANVALSAPLFMQLVVGVFSTMDGWLIAAIPMGSLTPADTAWSAIDRLGGQAWSMVARVFAVDALFSMANLGAHIACALMAAGSAIGVFYLAGFGLQLVVINKIMLVILLGLGPLFLCCLMFPATRGFCLGWARSLCASILTLVMFTAVAGFLITVSDSLLASMFADVAAAGTNALAVLGRTVLIFLLICGAGGEIFKWIPVIARNITGAFSIGPAFSAVTGPAARIAGHIGAAAAVVGGSFAADIARTAGGAAGGWLGRAAADRVNDGTRSGGAEGEASQIPIRVSGRVNPLTGTVGGVTPAAEHPDGFAAGASGSLGSAASQEGYFLVGANGGDASLAGLEDGVRQSGGEGATGTVASDLDGFVPVTESSGAGSLSAGADAGYVPTGTPGVGGAMAGMVSADPVENEPMDAPSAGGAAPAAQASPASEAAAAAAKASAAAAKASAETEPAAGETFGAAADRAFKGELWTQPAADPVQKAARTAIRGIGAVREAARKLDGAQLAARTYMAEKPILRTASRITEGAIARAAGLGEAVREDMAARNAGLHAPTEFSSTVNADLNQHRLERTGTESGRPGTDKPLTQAQFRARREYEESLRHAPHRRNPEESPAEKAAKYSVADGGHEGGDDD